MTAHMSLRAGLVFAVMVIGGACASEDGGPDDPPGGSTTNAGSGCRESVEVEMGSDGGLVETCGAWVIVPEGALAEPTTVSITRRDDPGDQPDRRYSRSVSPAFAFEPKSFHEHVRVAIRRDTVEGLEQMRYEMAGLVDGEWSGFFGCDPGRWFTADVKALGTFAIFADTTEYMEPGDNGTVTATIAGVQYQATSAPLRRTRADPRNTSVEVESVQISNATAEPEVVSLSMYVEVADGAARPRELDPLSLLYDGTLYRHDSGADVALDGSVDGAGLLSAEFTAAPASRQGDVLELEGTIEAQPAFYRYGPEFSCRPGLDQLEEQLGPAQDG